MISRFHVIAVIGLILVALTAVVGADYYVQAKAAMEQGEGYDLAEYMGSVDRRVSDASESYAESKDRRALRKAGVAAMMPDAPEGWTRRQMTAADAEILMPLPELADQMSKELMSDIMKSPTGAFMMKADAAARDSYVAEHQVYQAGDRLVAVHLAFDSNPRKGNGLMGSVQKMVMGQLANVSAQSGFALVQGVAYRQERGTFLHGAPDEGTRTDTATTRREFSAEIGRQVRISVKSTASDDEVYRILQGIDYDGLNGMLDEKLADVGSHVPTLPLPVQRRLAQQAEEERIARIKAEGDAATERLMGMSGKLSANVSAVATKEAKAGGLTDGAVAWFKSMTQGDGSETAAAEEDKPEVKVRRMGSGGGLQMQGGSGAGNCTTVGGVKRCRISSE